MLFDLGILEDPQRPYGRLQTISLQLVFIRFGMFGSQSSLPQPSTSLHLTALSHMRRATNRVCVCEALQKQRERHL